MIPNSQDHKRSYFTVIWSPPIQYSSCIMSHAPFTNIHHSCSRLPPEIHKVIHNVIHSNPTEVGSDEKWIIIDLALLSLFNDVPLSESLSLESSYFVFSVSDTHHSCS